jgi:hypothetical protein
MYKHVVIEEMKVEDFALGGDETRPNRLVARVFKSMSAYFDGDLSNVVAPDAAAEAWQFHARTYIQLITSAGRNEPDDRIGSIEVAFDKDLPLLPGLKVLIVPHTLWDTTKKAPWLQTLESRGVDIRPYLFTPGRHPEYYHSLLERVVRDLYQEWRLI